MEKEDGKNSDNDNDNNNNDNDNCYVDYNDKTK